MTVPPRLARLYNSLNAERRQLMLRVLDKMGRWDVGQAGRDGAIVLILKEETSTIQWPIHYVTLEHISVDLFEVVFIDERTRWTTSSRFTSLDDALAAADTFLSA